MKYDKKIIIIVVLVLIILGGGLFYAHDYVTNKAYQQGINDSTLLINQQLLNSLNQNGFINYMYPVNETDFINIKLIPQKYE